MSEQRAGADGAAVAGADQARIGLAGFRIDHREAGLLAGIGVAEAHLEAAVDGQQLYLVGNVGQEQHGGLAGGDLRQVRIQAAGDRQVVGGEVELADHQDLAVGGDAQDDLAVEGFLRRVDGEDLGAAGDQHRRGERGGEAVLRRIGLDRAVLRDHLRLDARQPLVGAERGGQLEIGATQFFRLVDRRQGLEELHAGREVVDREAGVRLEQDAARHRAGNEYADRPEFGDRELDGEAADAGHLEAALDADEEHAVDHWRGGVEAVDHRGIGIELDDAADQPGVDLAAEHLALELDADRGDVDDRELALEQQADVDLDPFDGARELEPVHALQAGHRRRQSQHEVGRVVLDVAPGDADLGDPDRQPGRPLEAGTGGRPDADEYPEAGLGDKSAIAQEGEVARFAAEHQRADGDLGADRTETHQFFVGRRRGVDGDVGRLQGQHRTERDPDGVGAEDEALDLAVFELQAEADRFSVRHPRRDVGLARQTVADDRRHRLARQEPGAARGEEDGAVEIDLLAEGDLEVGHADAQVVEFEDAGDADLAAAARGLRGVGGAAARLVDQHGLADVEAVLVDDQAGTVVGVDLALDAELREADRRLLHHQDALARAAVVRRLVVRVPVEDDAAGGDLDRVGDLDVEGGDLDAELARNVECVEQVALAGDASQRLLHVDADVEGTEQAGELGGDAAA